MRRGSAVFAALTACMLAQASVAQAVDSDAEAQAHKVALELAGAFSNDGFKLRDGTWKGALTTGEPQIIQVNLWAGNQYWFSVGTTEQTKKLAIIIYNELGEPQKSEPYAEGATAAAGFSPEASGPYYIKIEQLDGEPAAFCLLYSYK